MSIDCQGNTKSSLACWLSGAKHRIGCRGQYGTELSTYLNNILVTPERPHLTDRCVDLLAPVGITNPQIDWQLPGDEMAEHAAAKLLADLPLQGQFAIINPGATWESKLWEMDRFAAVARHLGERRGLKSLVVWGSKHELDFANQIVAAADGHAVLAPRTSLQELVAVLRRGAIFVSSDTGPLHMSVAVGTPSIGLYGATRPADCGPYGARTLESKCDMKVAHEATVARRTIQPCEKYRSNVSAVNVITCLMPPCVRWHKSAQEVSYRVFLVAPVSINSSCRSLFLKSVSYRYHP